MCHVQAFSSPGATTLYGVYRASHRKVLYPTLFIRSIRFAASPPLAFYLLCFRGNCKHFDAVLLEVLILLFCVAWHLFQRSPSRKHYSWYFPHFQGSSAIKLNMIEELLATLSLKRFQPAFTRIVHKVCFA